jgi:hypothetical protein
LIIFGQNCLEINKIIISQMEYNEFLARDSRLPRKHYPEKERGLGRNRGRDVNDYCLS